MYFWPVMGEAWESLREIQVSADPLSGNSLKGDSTQLQALEMQFEGL